MPCASCLKRKRKMLAAAGHFLTAIGRPIPRRVLDVTTGVRCLSCGFTADGVCFRWHETKERGICPKCGSENLTPGTARLT